MDDYDEAITFAKEILGSEIWLKDVAASKARIEADNQTEAHANYIFEEMKKAAEKENPDTLEYDVLILTAVSYLRDPDSFMMPTYLQTFVADVLEGKRQRPTTRGRDKYANWRRDYSLMRAVAEVAKKYELPHYTNNELSGKITAADIVSHAAGVSVDVVITAFKKKKHLL